MSETPAILGGSRAYGVPTDKSDWDIVVLIDPVTAQRLGDAFNEHGSVDSIKVGNLNLILTTSRKDYDVWLDGINRLHRSRVVLHPRGQLAGLQVGPLSC